ncbi:hypothetical protein BDQ17DRAFT_1537136 [Cyathus striatus]|nr:hypothetical protein BDQ17DRAFT_1537136 [Cyathus striatus]
MVRLGILLVRLPSPPILLPPALYPSSQNVAKRHYLVIGGSGFVGRHIVDQLLERGDSVSVFDIVQRYDDVPFYSGDITDEEQVANAIRKSGTTCIIHTASPPAGLKDSALYFKVNVDGTKAVIAAAVYIIDIDERVPYPEVPMDAYNESKAKAEEAVLAANGKGGLLTVALRPAGIFGSLPVYESGQTHYQIGDNTNLFDWTYVGNVAHAHLLAADKLDTQPPAPPLSSLEKLPATSDETPSSDWINHRKPAYSHLRSSSSWPYVEPPPNAAEIEAAFNNPKSATSNRPVVRTRFDQLSEGALKRAKLHKPDVHPLQVAGQVFFITNGEPCYFWDFPRTIWRQLDSYFPEKRKQRSLIKLPKSVGLFAASGSEWVSWAVGKEPTFTRFKVTFSCASRWHNIEKARRVLGYEPIVGVEDGAKRMVDWWHTQYIAGNHQQKH